MLGENTRTLSLISKKRNGRSDKDLFGQCEQNGNGECKGIDKAKGNCRKAVKTGLLRSKNGRVLCAGYDYPVNMVFRISAAG